MQGGRGREQCGGGGAAEGSSCLHFGAAVSEGTRKYPWVPWQQTRKGPCCGLTEELMLRQSQLPGARFGGQEVTKGQ